MVLQELSALCFLQMGFMGVHSSWCLLEPPCEDSQARVERPTTETEAAEDGNEHSLSGLMWSDAIFTECQGKPLCSPSRQDQHSGTVERT